MSLSPNASVQSGGAIGSTLRAILWVSAYLFFCVFPLFIFSTDRGGSYWWKVGIGLGAGGLATMALQGALTARFRRATAPFGVDIIYYFHRLMAMGGLALVVLHCFILRPSGGTLTIILNPFSAPGYLLAGRISLLLFAALVVSSIWRKSFRIEYDRWRIGHAVIAAAAVVFAAWHVCGAGAYSLAEPKGVIWGLYAVGWIGVLGYVRVMRPWMLLRRPYRVTDVRKERGRCWTVTLAPQGHAGIAFSPGQFAWLTLRTTPFHAKEHPFSFSGSATKCGLLQFTIKELGDFTRTIKNIKIGETAYVDGPHGIFTTDYHPLAPNFVFIAGGVGIAPLMSMLQTLADREDGRFIRLVYGSKCWEEILFREEIEELRTRLKLEVVYVLQEPPPEEGGALLGILSEAVVRTAIPDPIRDAIFFVCGPKPMSDSVQRTLRGMKVPLWQIHCELFDMA